MECLSSVHVSYLFHILSFLRAIASQWSQQLVGLYLQIINVFDRIVKIWRPRDEMLPRVLVINKKRREQLEFCLIDLIYSQQEYNQRVIS